MSEIINQTCVSNVKGDLPKIDFSGIVWKIRLRFAVTEEREGLT
jgi:hypothetical protein